MKQTSVFQSEKACYYCRTTNNLQVHHIFNGRSYRDKCDKDKMLLYVCVRHHNALHNGWKKVNEKETELIRLKQKAQMVREGLYGTREDFIRRYGKSYI